MATDFLGQPARAHLGLSSRQCTATSKATGERCRRTPIAGGFVCALHGGSAPQTIAAARQRLLEAAVPAAGVLARAIEQHGPTCPTCGRSDDDRDPVALRAAQLILDRVGLQGGVTVEVQPAAPRQAPPYMAWVPEDRLRDLLRQVAALHREAQAAMERGDPPCNVADALPASRADAIDVDVVETPTTDEPTQDPQGSNPPGN